MPGLNISSANPLSWWLNDDLLKPEQADTAVKTPQRKGRLPEPSELTEPALLNSGRILPQNAPDLASPDALKNNSRKVAEIAEGDKPSFYTRLSAMLIDTWRNLMKSLQRETEISGQRDVLALKTTEQGANALYKGALESRTGAIGGAVAGIGFAAVGTMKKINSNTKHGEQSAKLLEQNQKLRTDINANKKVMVGNDAQIRKLDQESRLEMKQAEKLNKKNNLLEKEQHQLKEYRQDIDNKINAARESGLDDKALQTHKGKIDKQLGERDNAIKANNKELERLDKAEELRDNQRNELRTQNDKLIGENGDLELEIENNNIEINRIHILQDNDRAQGDMWTQASHPMSTLVSSPNDLEAAKLNREAKLNDTAADITSRSARNRQESAQQDREARESTQRAQQELLGRQNSTLEAIISNIRV